MTEITAFDIVVLLIVLLGAIMGALRGFVQVALSLAAWFVSAFAVHQWYQPVRNMLDGFVETRSASALVAVLATFFVPFIIIRFLAAGLGAKVRSSVIGPIDRFLGFGFGIIRAVLIASLFYLVVAFGYNTMFGGGAPRPEWLRASRTEPLLKVTSAALVHYVEQARARKPGEAAGYDARARAALDDLTGR